MMLLPFFSFEIDGETLLLLTLEDLEETLGKGLGTKRIWKEISRLQRSYNEPGKAPAKADMFVEEKEVNCFVVLLHHYKFFEQIPPSSIFSL